MRSTASTSISAASGKAPRSGQVGAVCVGCWSRRLAVTSSDSGQIPPDVNVAHAFLSKPSRANDIARRIRAASDISPAVRGLFCAMVSFQRAMRSPSSRLLKRSSVNVVEARACLLPPRGSGDRTVFGSISNSVHASTELYAETAAKQRIRACAHKFRSALGTCFFVGVWAACTDSEDGKCLGDPVGSTSIRSAEAAAWARCVGLHVGCTFSPQTWHLHLLCLPNHASGMSPCRDPAR